MSGTCVDTGVASRDGPQSDGIRARLNEVGRRIGPLLCQAARLLRRSPHGERTPVQREPMDWRDLNHSVRRRVFDERASVDCDSHFVGRLTDRGQQMRAFWAARLSAELIRRLRQ